MPYSNWYPFKRLSLVSFGRPTDSYSRGLTLYGTRGPRFYLPERPAIMPRTHPSGLRMPRTSGKVSFFAQERFAGNRRAIMLRKDGFVRVKKAAEILGVCPNTVRAWGAEGKLTEYRHPVNNYRLFKRRELDQILRKLHLTAMRRTVSN